MLPDRGTLIINGRPSDFDYSKFDNLMIWTMSSVDNIEFGVWDTLPNNIQDTICE